MSITLSRIIFATADRCGHVAIFVSHLVYKMSLFKKPKKNIRRRVIGNIDEEEGGDENERKVEEEENNIQPQGNVSTKTKEKKKEKRKQSVLSFEEELNEGNDIISVCIVLTYILIYVNHILSYWWSINYRV